MKQILLTDEEIQRVVGGDFIVNPQYSSLLKYLRDSNKVQLKKVVDMLQKCDGDLVSRDNKPFMATFEMLAEDWEAMLKEVE